VVIAVLSPIILPNVFYGKSLLRLIQRLERVTDGEGLSHPLPLFPVQGDQGAAKAQGDSGIQRVAQMLATCYNQDSARYHRRAFARLEREVRNDQAV